MSFYNWGYSASLGSEESDLPETNAKREYVSQKEKEAAVRIAQGIQDAHQLFTDCSKQMLENASLCHWESSLGEPEMSPCNKSIYSILKFEPLHNLHGVIWKLVEKCTIRYISRDVLRMITDNPNFPREPPCSRQTTLLEACISILAATEKEYCSPGLHVDISKKGTDTQVNGSMNAGSLQKILQGTNYGNTYMFFPSIVGFVDRWTRWMKDAPWRRYTCSFQN